MQALRVNETTTIILKGLLGALFIIAVATGIIGSELANLDKTSMQFSINDSAVTLTHGSSFISVQE